MDAGLAAVLGALAGSVATIGTALATSWAQRESARIAVRSEHRRERRQPREAIYKEFIAATTRMRVWTGKYAIGADMIPSGMAEEESDRLFLAVGELERASADAALAGPRDVTEAALRIARLSLDIAARVGTRNLYLTGNEERDWDTWKGVRRDVHSTAKQFEKCVDDFVLRAQSALDDDGSRK